jgi:hypothetical protein
MDEYCATNIIGLSSPVRNRLNLQCFRVRAGVFASAHGRPNGVPGRIIGARAKTLRQRESSIGGIEHGRDGRVDLKLQI